MDKDISRKMYGWNKYGGATKGIFKDNSPEWYCQICGEKQTNHLPIYYIPEDKYNRDWMRVCSGCKSTSITFQAMTYSELKITTKVVSRMSIPNNLANLTREFSTIQV